MVGGHEEKKGCRELNCWHDVRGRECVVFIIE